MKKENESKHEQELFNFITYCKNDSDFIDFKYYKNSVVIYFKLQISSDILEKLKTINNKFFVYKSMFVGCNEIIDCLSLLIYKKNNYVFD